MTFEPLNSSATIAGFLDATAARQPAPGGGAVTALAGALATAIGQMVLSYSVGKKDLAPHAAKLETAVAQLIRARGVFLELMIEDQSAFAAHQAAKKSGSAEETAKTLAACIGIPRAVGATAFAVLSMSEALVPIVNKYLLSDLAVCVELAMATLRCASYNVKVNLAELTSNDERDGLSRELYDEISRGVAILKRTIASIAQSL